MEDFKDRESSNILSRLDDLIEDMKSRAVEARGIGRVVEEGWDFHEDRETMAGLGSGIRRLLIEAEEIGVVAAAGIKELRERCSPRQPASNCAATRGQNREAVQ